MLASENRLGYVDYEVYNRWTQRGISFVTRLKANAVREPLVERPVTGAETAAS
jgi:hypothetical protein